jgi:hypothetical protein
VLPDVLTVIEKGWTLYRYLQERRTRELLTSDTSRRVLELYDFLRVLYYDLDMLAGPGGYFPVGVLPLDPRAVDDPDALVGELVPRPADRPVLEPRVVEAIKRRGSGIWDGTTFSLSRLAFAGANVASIDAYIGSYFDMVSSADYLEYELLAAIDRGRGPVGLSNLPAREAALSSFDAPRACLVNGGGVDAVLAVSTLVVYAREGRYWMLCDVRSGRVAEYGNLYHVAPSFIFQPVTSLTGHNLAIEWRVTHNVYREYLEELFDVPEVEHAAGAVAADYFYDHPNLLFLRELLRSGAARLRGTAVIVNLLNHRPEICTLLLITDEGWFQRQKDLYAARRNGLEYLRLNSEFVLGASQRTDSDLEAVTTLPVDDPRWGQIVQPWLMVPPAAPALVLGARAALELLGLDQPPWLRPFRMDPARADPYSIPPMTGLPGETGR